MSDSTLLPKRFSNITPSDTVNINFLMGVYIGVGGDVKVTGIDGVAVIFQAGSNSYLSGCFYKVMATGTTATNIVGLHSQ
jgi:hypothetical protein